METQKGIRNIIKSKGEKVMKQDTKQFNRVHARVDLDAIKYNLEQMKHRIGEKTEIVAVVKADGCGHGAVAVATMQENLSFIWGFATASLDEAVILRDAGIAKPIMVLGCTFPDQYQQALDYQLTITIFSEELASQLSEMAVSMNKQVPVHIKVDTGMSRIGFQIDAMSVQAIERIHNMPGLRIEGMYTHFAKADEVDKTFTNQQIDAYLWMASELQKRGISLKYQHCANSAGIIDVERSHMDLVRTGISMYGLYPSQDVVKENVLLKPALQLISHVVQVKEIEKGTPVSYGGTFVSDKRMKVATIPVGYADGYPRSLSGKGDVLIHGKRARILGRICMDQFMVDVTHIEGVCFGDRVTLIGEDGKESISIQELSEISDRFNYEFASVLGKRVPRVYIQNNQVTGVLRQQS